MSSSVLAKRGNFLSSGLGFLISAFEQKKLNFTTTIFTVESPPFLDSNHEIKTAGGLLELVAGD
jgi:hypothetical protein